MLIMPFFAQKNSIFINYMKSLKNLDRIPIHTDIVLYVYAVRLNNIVQITTNPKESIQDS